MASNNNQLIALLGLLAVAGYQNRDKIGEVLGSLTGQRQGTAGAAPSTGGGGLGGALGGGGLGGLLGSLGGMFGGSAPSAGNITGGLGQLVDQMTQNGHGSAVQSWVTDGPGRELDEGQLEQALGGNTLDALVKQTGLSKDELLSRLRAVLPSAVDKLTPDGVLPAAPGGGANSA
jgi:uncharacterized protein YidB (DUF937 family)